MKQLVYLIPGAAALAVAMLVGASVWGTILPQVRASMNAMGGTAPSAISLLGLWIIAIPIMFLATIILNAMRSQPQQPYAQR